MNKMYASIGCCGIDCGLCPRYYTEGASRCPGCGGPDFECLHPPCSHKSCCSLKHGLEVCGQCEEFPCIKYDREKIERDSFVTHQRIFKNHEQIGKVGLDAFLDQQKERISLLEKMLADYDGGRGKSFFCLASALLSPEGLWEALSEADLPGDRKDRERALRVALTKYAELEGIVLKLTKLSRSEYRAG